MKCWNIEYTLKEPDGRGGLKAFPDDSAGTSTAYIMAESAEEAEARLREDFSPLKVEVSRGAVEDPDGVDPLDPPV